MSEFAVLFVKFYQKFISKFTPKSCRYYPSCSEYAIWQFKHNNPFLAIFYTVFRILKCNQLFKGGIDYPVIRKNFSPFNVFTKFYLANIIFWFVPFGDDKFYVIKNLRNIYE